MSPVLIIVSLVLLPVAAVASQAPPPAQLIGVTRAVQIAEENLSATALEADLDGHKGKMVYEVELLHQATVYKTRVDALTGAVIESVPKRVESLWRRWFDADSLGAVVKGGLAPILAALEREKNGHVREVGFDNDHGLAHYEIELGTAAGTADIYIDARSGEQMADGFAR